MQCLKSFWLARSGLGLSRPLSTTCALPKTYHKDSDILTLVAPEDGRRQVMVDAEKRFKRLDWGIFIRTRAGRHQSRYKRSGVNLWQMEQHVFGVGAHDRRLNRMMGSQVKARRFLPEDIYDKYNQTSYNRHIFTKLKNRQNIQSYGNPIHRFPRWNAHLSKYPTRYNFPEKLLYEPPGYVGNVGRHAGVYRPEFIPADLPAPSITRPLVRMNRWMKDKYLQKALVLEALAPRCIPLYHPLLKPMFKKY